MHIVHVIRQYKPSVGGLEDAMFNLCRHLNHIEGCSARIVTLNRVFTNPTEILPDHEIMEGIDVTRIPFSGSSRYPFAPDVLQHIRNADIVHVHAVDFFFDFLSLFRFLHGKKLVASTHGGFFHTQFAAKLKKIYFQTVTRFSCMGYKTICASSENDAATFRTISPRNVVTIENGVNVEKWRDAGSKTPQKHLIFIGRWSANKRVPMLIRLLAALHTSDSGWNLTIAGLPADETVQSLMALAQELGVEANIRIAASPSEEEIKQLLGNASYIASASGYEGFGISIIEGLSAGLYPIVSPLPPFIKLINLLGAGIIMDVDQLQNTAHSISAEHARLSAETEALRQKCITFSSQYAWEGVARKFYEVYKAVLHG